jgi:hypothetical protein
LSKRGEKKRKEKKRKEKHILQVGSCRETTKNELKHAQTRNKIRVFNFMGYGLRKSNLPS